MRLGVLGGTFDPVHAAHLFVAERARTALGLDRILFVPSRGGRYREAPVAALEHRLAMLRLAIAPNSAFALELCDLDDEATGYTADLLPRLARRHPASTLTFVAGADSVLESAWARFDEVLAGLERFAVAARGGSDEAALAAWRDALPEPQRAKIAPLPGPALALSATLIRTEIAHGRGVRYLVPDAVAAYLAAERPYGGASRGD